MTVPLPATGDDQPVAAHEIDFGRPQHPGVDPFSIPPAGYESAVPGTVLRSRTVRLAFLGIVPQQAQAYQLLYRSTDFTGVPQATITTIIRPRGTTGGRAAAPVVSFQCAIDSLAPSAFPSYVFRRHAKALGGVPPFEYLLIACALAKGWTVLVPDHEGTRGSWGVAREPGYCVLDGIRAAQKFELAGIAGSAPVALWGYSGGGLATGWAAELWKSYAPELNIVGAVLGSPVADPGEVFHDLNGSVFAGEPALVLASLVREYPALAAIVRTHANERGRAMLDRLPQMTLIAALRELRYQDCSQYLDRPLDEVFALPEVTEVLDDIRLGGTGPVMPLLMMQAVHDILIRARHIDALVERYRLSGTHVTYLRDRLSEHFVLHPASTPVTLDWIADRFADKPLEPASTRDTRLLLSARSLAGLLWMGWITISVVLGLRIAKS